MIASLCARDVAISQFTLRGVQTVRWLGSFPSAFGDRKAGIDDQTGLSRARSSGPSAGGGSPPPTPPHAPTRPMTRASGSMGRCSRLTPFPESNCGPGCCRQWRSSCRKAPGLFAGGFVLSQKIPQFATAARVAQLAQRLGFDLPHALACHTKLLPDLFQGVAFPVL